MKMTLKKGENKRSTRTRYNVDFLKDREVTEIIRLTTSNIYQALQDLLDEENINIDTKWHNIKKATWTSTSKEILVKKKCQNKERILLTLSTKCK
ncbi:hypothetical protein LSAT2_012603 [Lamellibrachia satsuma]|nr:hypothetical protein LSAT2_012603 [Lamellibrachia satsuma]